MLCSVLCCVWFEYSLNDAIANGREFKIHWLVAAIYNAVGIWGTRMLFGAVGVMGALITRTYFEKWKAEKRLIQEVRN